MKGVQRSHSQLSDLSDGQSDDVDEESNLFFFEPALGFLSSLQISQKISLIAVLSHQYRLLSEFVNVINFD
jgi:hypothetical protein